jgi:hypothetical protein
MGEDDNIAQGQQGKLGAFGKGSSRHGEPYKSPVSDVGAKGRNSRPSFTKIIISRKPLKKATRGYRFRVALLWKPDDFCCYVRIVQLPSSYCSMSPP